MGSRDGGRGRCERSRGGAGLLGATANGTATRRKTPQITKAASDTTSARLPEDSTGLSTSSTPVPGAKLVKIIAE